MKYEMRNLTGKDLFPVLSLLGKLNLKDDIVEMVDSNREAAKERSKLKAQLTDENTEDETMEEEDGEEGFVSQGIKVFAGLAQKVLERIDVVGKDINKLLASLTGETVETIENLPLNDYMDLIFSFFEKEELKSFFTCIVERFKKTQSTN